MNVGELKLTPKFFNSQAQLNNDWFLNENNSDFKTILKEKTVKRSAVQDTKITDVKSEPAKPMKAVKQEVKAPVDQKVESEDLKEVTSKINEAIKKNKYEKENGDGDLKLDELEEKIKALEEAVMEEMGIVVEEPVLEQIAEILGMSLEALVEQISSEGDNEELMTEIVSLMEGGDLSSKELIQVLEHVFSELEAEQKVELNNFLEGVIEKMPEGEAKETLTEFEQVLEKIVEETGEKVEVKTEAVEVKPVEKDTQIQNTQPVQQEVSTEKPVEEVETKNESNQDQPTQKDGEPLMNADVKLVKQETSQNFNIEEQINMIKAESSTITGVKESPKAMLSRSVMNQVVQGTKMSINMSDQGSEIMIKLNPKNLGNVSLKMAFEKGTLLAQIQVENQTVKGIIESNLDDLRSALRDEGYQIGDLDVSVNKESSGESNQGFTGGNKKRFVKFESFDEVEEQVMKQKASQEGIDYLA